MSREEDRQILTQPGANADSDEWQAPWEHYPQMPVKIECATGDATGLSIAIV
jgi:hypothetical protein